MDNFDWFVWEPLDSAHVCTPDGRRTQASPSDMQAVVCDGAGNMTLHVPLGRHGSIIERVHVPLPATCGNILLAVHTFFHRPVTHRFVERLQAADGFAASQTHIVEDKIVRGQETHMFELNGGGMYGLLEHLEHCGFETGRPVHEPQLFGQNRRDPVVHCQGRVRFEGLQANSHFASSSYIVLLGS